MGARPPPMFDLVGSSVANVLAGTISNIKLFGLYLPDDLERIDS